MAMLVYRRVVFCENLFLEWSLDVFGLLHYSSRVLVGQVSRIPILDLGGAKCDDYGPKGLPSGDVWID